MQLKTLRTPKNKLSLNRHSSSTFFAFFLYTQRHTPLICIDLHYANLIYSENNVNMRLETLRAPTNKLSRNRLSSSTCFAFFLYTQRHSPLICNDLQWLKLSH